MNEFDFIATHLRPLATSPGAHSLMDDGASLPPLGPGQEWRITTDTLNDGVHFRLADGLASAMHRALASNISDLVAQLATPELYLLNLSFSPETDLEALGQGLRAAQAHFGLSLLGGDTTRSSGPLTLTITAFGRGQQGLNPLRTCAKVGHHIGLILPSDLPLGAARAGFEGVRRFARAFLYPETCRTLLGDGPGELSKIAAMADVSDGLLADLGHICAASRVGAEVWLPSLPLALPNEQPLPQITWGDDYALVLTAQMLPARALPIGRVVAGQGVKLLDAERHEIAVERAGYLHL